MTRSERVYRKLLLVYPPAFRDQYEEEMVRLFLDQLRDARHSARPGEPAALWLRTVTDIASSAPGELIRRESPVAKQVDPGSVALDLSPQGTGPTRLGYALASLPFLLLIGAPLIAPDPFAPIFANPPGILGLPFGIVALFLVATWAAIAFVVIRVARSRAWIGFALLVFTFPSIIVIILVPAVILVILNLNV